MSDDKIVYLKGGRPQVDDKRDEDKVAAKAVRSALVDAMLAYRAGEIRAIAIISLEHNSTSYRLAGNCTDAEFVAALEYTKFGLIVSD